MAENLEPFHVPQRNRKTKLRFSQSNQDQPATWTPQLLLTSSSLQNLHDLKHRRLSTTSSGGLLNHNGELRSTVPLGPFTGYASVLKTSRFLKPAQQILDEVCGIKCEASSSSFPLDCFSESEVMRRSFDFDDRTDKGWKNSKLRLMLDELYRKYKLYYHQMESVTSSFRSVAGLGNAAPYICYAIKLVSNQFTCLKNALLDQIDFRTKTSADGSGNGTKQNTNPVLQNHVWRSQRGLPEHAVAVLKSWLFEHFLHPYPTDSEKQTLSLQTGLSRTQVSNWFINARVRLWKPMVEEVHMLESKRSQELEQEEEAKHDSVMQSDFLQTQKIQTEPHQRQEQDQHYSTTNWSGNQQPEVSLVLGLEQSTRRTKDLSSHPAPININHCLDLELLNMMQVHNNHQL